MRIETCGLSKQFGGVYALDDVSVEFPSHSITAIIGPNGAGKTTLFNVMAGLLRPDRGSVTVVSESGAKPVESLDGSVDIVSRRLKPHEVARLGIGVLFQDVRVFRRLTAFENVAVGASDQAGESALNCLIRPGLVRRDEARTAAKARQLLEYVGLADKQDMLAERLSYGEQKLVAIARLLAGNARILLLDEPTSGVHPSGIDRLLALINRLADEDGHTVIMIEHNLNTVARVGDWVYLMAEGRVEVFGPPKEVLRESSLRSAFPNL